MSGLPYSVLESSRKPTCMCGAVVAAGAARPTTAHAAARTATNRLYTRWFPPQRGQPAAQAFFEIDLGLPTEHVARARDVGPPHLRVVGEVVRRRLERDLARRAGDADYGLRQPEHGQLVVGVPDVDRQVLVRLGERHEPANGVVGVAEAARLRSVAEYRERLTCERLLDERHRRSAVVPAHPRPVRIEDPGDTRVDALLVVVRHRQRLGVALRLVVHAARADGVDVAPVRLRLRRHQRVAVDLARRREQEPRALVLREAERVVSPVRPDLERVQRQAHVVDRARDGRQVVDDVDRLADVDVLDDVVVHERELGPATDVRDVLEAAGLEVVDADDAVVPRQQVIAEMGAEEPRATRYDRSRHPGEDTQRLRDTLPVLTGSLRRLAAGATFSTIRASPATRLSRVALSRRAKRRAPNCAAFGSWEVRSTSHD